MKFVPCVSLFSNWRLKTICNVAKGTSMSYAISEGRDQPACLCNLARTSIHRYFCKRATKTLVRLFKCTDRCRLLFLILRPMFFFFFSTMWMYLIQPNYRTVRLGFSKLLGTLICDKLCTYLLRIHYSKKKDQKRTYLMMIMRIFLIFIIKACWRHSFELYRQVDAIQMSIHNICLYKEVRKKYTGCNLKTTEFLDCALIGVCVVNRSNTVYMYRTLVIRRDKPEQTE